MIKKIFLSTILISTITIYISINYFFEDTKLDNKLLNQVVDIKNRSDLIRTYSILIKEVIPANEQQ
jgi:hypothetical protein